MMKHHGQSIEDNGQVDVSNAYQVQLISSTNIGRQD